MEALIGQTAFQPDVLTAAAVARCEIGRFGVLRGGCAEPSVPVFIRCCGLNNILDQLILRLHYSRVDGVRIHIKQRVVRIAWRDHQDHLFEGLYAAIGQGSFDAQWIGA